MLAPELDGIFMDILNKGNILNNKKYDRRSNHISSCPSTSPWLAHMSSEFLEVIISFQRHYLS
jgi:hypothetical protein